jgi:dolichol-phosphate mannosyltransferase
MSDTEPRRLSLAIAVPMANEERGIDPWMERVLLQLTERDHIVAVVDRASVDGTRAKLEEWAERDRRVHCVWEPANRSVVDAYFAAYRAALATGCDWILEMDAGFSHLPEEIPRFVAAMSRGVDFACGSRFMRGGRYSGPPSRYVVSRGGSVLANLVLGSNMADMTSGFECFSRKAMEYIVERGTRSRTRFFQTEIRYLLSSWNWVAVPITYSNPSERLKGSDITDALKQLWQLRRSI